MKAIKDLVNNIDDELHSAKEYTEKYLELKLENNTQLANKYKEMANDELRHANVIHEHAISEIEQLRTVYEPPAKMQKIWDEKHKKYIEKTSWIKMMLSL